MRNPKRQSGSIIRKRGSGILLHITSLPSCYGIGDFGPQAYKFVEFMRRTKQRYWQILPLTPANYVHEYSPYNCMSAFAGNKYLISPELMMRDGFIKNSELESVPRFSNQRVQFSRMITFKEEIFQRAYERFMRMKRRSGYTKFCKKNEYWLDDWALFTALNKDMQNKAWVEWPLPIRDRDAKTIAALRKSLKQNIEQERFLQYVFSKQWQALKDFCNRNHITVIGDIPIYVDYNSVDVWAHPEMFKLDGTKQPTHVSGVPPDYFSKDGQLWGNPLYRWNVMKKNGYRWWLRRFEHNSELFDLVRMDHFRGFVAYWQVPRGAKTARRGKWSRAPTIHFLQTIKKKLGRLPIIAEDLGTITPDVHDVIRRFGLPGMRVLLFAFGDNDSANPYLPHNYIRNCVVYTGTHDNNTVRGWFDAEASPREIQMLFAYLGKKTAARDVPEAFVRMAMMSVANTVIIPMQDILRLGGNARMNRPASIRGNWKWRLTPRYLKPSCADRLGIMTETYGRG